VVVRVLLVDDHPLFRDGFALMLKHHRADWSLQTANSGADALSVLAEIGAPDLAIIDIQLPDMDGFDAALALSARAPLTPRIMISGRRNGSAAQP